MERTHHGSAAVEMDELFEEQALDSPDVNLMCVLPAQTTACNFSQAPLWLAINRLVDSPTSTRARTHALVAIRGWRRFGLVGDDDRWDDFSVDEYAPIVCKRKKPQPKRWTPAITVPDPFSFDSTRPKKSKAVLEYEVSTLLCTPL